MDVSTRAGPKHCADTLLYIKTQIFDDIIQSHHISSSNPSWQFKIHPELSLQSLTDKWISPNRYQLTGTKTNLCYPIWGTCTIAHTQAVSNVRLALLTYWIFHYIHVAVTPGLLQLCRIRRAGYG